MNKNNLRNVSSKIRKSRRVLNLSQAELSKKLDISPSYLNLIESGKRPITVPLLIKLGNIFFIIFILSSFFHAIIGPIPIINSAGIIIGMTVEL